MRGVQDVMRGVQDVMRRMKEGMRRVLLCMLEVAEGELCLLEAMHCVLLCMLEAVENGLWIQFRGFEISILWQFSRYIPRPCMANPSRTPPHHSE